MRNLESFAEIFSFSDTFNEEFGKFFRDIFIFRYFHLADRYIRHISNICQTLSDIYTLEISQTYSDKENQRQRYAEINISFIPAIGLFSDIF